jgi:hypothetical protein
MADQKAGVVVTKATDGDLALNPQELEPTPEISAIMRGAGFHAFGGGSPGVWIVSVDMRGDCRDTDRSDRSHGGRVEHGEAWCSPRGPQRPNGQEGLWLEAVLVDNEWKTIGALDRDDARLVESRVAGPTALLVARARKISDRLAETTKPHRRDDKDALEVYRLMQTTPVATTAAVLPELLSDTRTQRATQAGLGLIVQLFGVRRAAGVEMAVRALQGSVRRPRSIGVYDFRRAAPGTHSLVLVDH